MTAFVIQEVTPPEPELLRRIGRLRVVAWQPDVPEFARTGPLLDEWDAAARHWAIFCGEELVAAARMSVHDRLTDVPDAVNYAALFADRPPPGPIASLNRLVVHPSWRRLGLSRQLDSAVLNAAEAAGCLVAVGATSTVGGHRVRQMQRMGFRVVGVGPKSDQPPWCFAPPPTVLICNLPRYTAASQISGYAELDTAPTTVPRNPPYDT